MIVDDLLELGLSEPEAKIYVDLIQQGSSLAGELAKRSQINRTTVYDALERLKKKGFVTYSVVSGRKMFQAMDPKHVVRYYEDKFNQARKTSEELSKMHVAQKELFELYEGKRGIKSILDDILNYSSYVAYGSSGKFLEIMKHDFLLFQKRKKELKITSKILQTQKNKELVEVSHASFRYLPSEHANPVTTIVYGDKVAILIWSTTPHALLIESEVVAKQYLEQFEMLWKIGKK